MQNTVKFFASTQMNKKVYIFILVEFTGKNCNTHVSVYSLKGSVFDWINSHCMKREKKYSNWGGEGGGEKK